ncbi:hypothetical protein DIZ27_23245 [Streptomyces sp. NWU339]|uniref:hypothetical protein n=1 Tax=Streptomyces sp. NWU339 TaxID=2185284 RepID=UPI000D678073|nr:hypothetical protein [Streptomyces sp. NWU339]PWI08357.1 hypothetical protein DIZ27_23245 [Streptomyces sp. NWU339]
MTARNYPAERIERYVAALRDADTHAQLTDRRDLERFARAVMAVADKETDPVYRSGYATGRMHAGAPTEEFSDEARLAQLLDTIRTHGGKWSTGSVQAMRRTTGGPVHRGTARRDLAELARRGHLTKHGAGDGRFYTLTTRKDGAV